MQALQGTLKWIYAIAFILVIAFLQYVFLYAIYGIYASPWGLEGHVQIMLLRNGKLHM